MIICFRRFYLLRILVRQVQRQQGLLHEDPGKGRWLSPPRASQK